MKKTKKRVKDPLVEIARSFSYKLNVGNYESRDFFCSQKVECPMSKSEEMSEKLYLFCRGQVLKEVQEYIKLRAKKLEPEEVIEEVKWTPDPKKNGTWTSRARVTTKLEHIGSAVIHGEIDEANKTFNTNPQALVDRQK